MEYEFVLNVLYTCRWYQCHVEVSNFNQNVNIWVKYACVDFFYTRTETFRCVKEHFQLNDVIKNGENDVTSVTPNF